MLQATGRVISETVIIGATSRSCHFNCFNKIFSAVLHVIIGLLLNFFKHLKESCIAGKFINKSFIWKWQIFWYQKPLLVPILSQINPVHTTPSYLRSILILSIHIRLDLPSDLFASGFPKNTLYAFLFWPIRATCRALWYKAQACLHFNSLLHIHEWHCSLHILYF
jgi:hypothetical protein